MQFVVIVTSENFQIHVGFHQHFKIKKSGYILEIINKPKYGRNLHWVCVITSTSLKRPNVLLKHGTMVPNTN